MSEMIRRVADALQAHQLRHGPDYEGLARVAVEAMREPTEEMIDAADDAGDKRDHVRIRDSRASAEVEWRAMIDEALKD